MTWRMWASVQHSTAQYSTVQRQSALSQCGAAPASTSPLRHPSYLVSSLYCNTVIYSDLDNVKKVKGDVIS